MKLLGSLTLFLSIVMLSSVSFAGHHYHGYGSYHGSGCSMSDWEMEKLDLDKGGTLSFEEFGGNQLEQLQAAFKMIDTNKDGELDLDEWNEFLKVHGKVTEKG